LIEDLLDESLLLGQQVFAKLELGSGYVLLETILRPLLGLHLGLLLDDLNLFLLLSLDLLDLPGDLILDPLGLCPGIGQDLLSNLIHGHARPLRLTRT